ncbi:putative mycofactocin system creatinine amidohydrolase family protein MftE [subsurface metagenome]
MPLGTDCLIPETILEKLEPLLNEKGIPTTILPIIPYGTSDEHRSYKGTISLSVKTLIDLLTDVGDSCARAGFKKMILFNGHGGNLEILDFMVREIRIRTGMNVFVIHPFLKIIPESLKLDENESKYGIHAGQIETSIILNIDSSLVHKEKYKVSYPESLAGKLHIDLSGKVPFGWATEDLSSSGVIGNPFPSTKEEGDRLLNEVTAYILDIVQEINEFTDLRSGEEKNKNV